MPPLQAFIAPSSRVTRSSQRYKTPEPSAEDSAAPSSVRPRFRLKKRTASNLSAPTQHFLASVAAADVPIPSIEEPHVVDDDMIDSTPSAMAPLYSVDMFAQPKRGRAFSPRTPAPDGPHHLSPTQFPDWALESPISSRDSSPEYESSRPSTAVSTQTSSSLFSRFSMNSDDQSLCISPEVDQSDRFCRFLSVDDAERTIRNSAPVRGRRAPWTRAMSQHLWATYMTYLQDPKVTPFRIGKSGIPPHGVCLRVAREARRSWRRGKSHAKDGRLPMNSTVALAWPHTCGATRAHLRDLCKANVSSTSRDGRFGTNSPAPLMKAPGRFRSRRSAPLTSSTTSVFSSSDMAMSLAVSTCESMQPNGPLAQLTSSKHSNHDEQQESAGASFFSQLPSSRSYESELGSPFVVRSYGPSSSNTLQGAFGISPEQPRQSRTTGPRRLASPVRLTQSRPGSQKRRPAFLENRTRKRPSLASDFWTAPGAASNSPLMSEFSSTTANKRDALFVPRTNLQEMFEASRSGNTAQEGSSSSLEAPGRLGSPFPGSSSSKSLPNRFSSPARLDAEPSRKQYATFQQQGAEPNASEKPTLASRLALLDKHLRDFRRQDDEARRSQSPQ